MLLVVLPVANVVAAICVNHASLTIMFIIFPVPVIAHAVQPDLLALTMSLLSIPLSFVLSPLFDQNFVFRHDWLTHFLSVFEFAELFEDLLGLGAPVLFLIAISVNSDDSYILPIDGFKLEPGVRVVWRNKCVTARIYVP